jgi:hypothetical protein
MGDNVMADDHLKAHLEFILEIIERLARNSFLLKGWSVTLVAASFLLIARGGAAHVAAIALLPSLAFWGLDAYYLRQERMYRRLFNRVRVGELAAADRFTLDARPYAPEVQSWWRTLFRPTVGWFHGCINLVVIMALYHLA